ncbi:rRNA (cytosine-C(5))-methyltransferase NOP2C [Citrus sinensis]|uniref:rRNA (cytosine-C(5))-methyltransferase NOP2C isoform X1 n=1 Tax=Citrus sinensis TaxID=2711 RepID=UPI0003D792AF|nr:rRNA (cytosine-C(5))-methyltransferase NOP2C isoform X1 [Citrus sinensis]KAH9706068.1 rRNA (cytosine-C(5))-methyltransferase NOP2C [Citrus sinensis]
MKKARDCLCLCLLKTFRRSFLTLQNPTPKMDLSGRYSYSPLLRWNPQVEEYFIRAYGADHFSRISKALTRPSCYSCIRVNTLKTTTDDVIQKLLAIIQNSGSSEADVASSVKGRLQNGTISESQIPGLEYVVFVKGSGPHTIDYGYEPDKPPKEVIVSRKCAEAVLRGAQVYVPGVMACSSHVEKGDVVAVSVAVEQPTLDGGWGLGITRGTVLQGSQTDPYYFERSGLYIGQGTAMMSRAGIFRASEGIAVDMHNRIFQLLSFYDVLEGEIFLQNLPSIVTAHALDPQKGERILDMCAAPGGKTTAIASLLRDEGEVVAVDRSHNKVMDIQKLAAEMGLKCITTYKLDALKAVRRKNESNDEPNMCNSKDNNYITSQTSDSMKLHKEVPSIAAEGLNGDKSCKEKVSNEKGVERTYVSKADTRKNMRRMRNGPGRNQCLGGRAENSKGFSPNSFDRVLLDAPCSALGLRPRLFAAEETIQSLRNHGKYQRRMFDQAVQLVRPGGIIVYSTCTINPGENEALVRYALDRYKFLSLAPQHPRIGGPGLVGRYEFPDGYVEEWLKPGEEELVQRFDPSSPLDTIGFFIAKFTVGPA